LNSSNYVNFGYGKLSICQLTSIQDISYSGVLDFYQQLAQANTFGIQSQNYGLVIGDSYDQELTPRTIWTNSEYSVMTYRFQDLDPNDPQTNVVTNCTISSTAHCREYKVVEGGNGSTSLTTYISDSGDRVAINMGKSPWAWSPTVPK
jgi:hypothetical protein